MAEPWWWAAGGVGAVVLCYGALVALDRVAFRRTVRAVLAEHAQALARRRAQLVRVDDYGVEIDKAWRKEMRHFFDNVLLSRLGPHHQKAALERGGELMALIDAAARERAAAVASEPVRSSAAAGAEFELRCRELLEEAGWAARLTAGTGDQGADIVAEKGGTTVVLQCKRYARPVGNKAVQEVAAARTYYGADVAAVVSNSDYTEAARRLAHRNGVHLLHVDDLRDPDGRLGRHAG